MRKAQAVLALAAVPLLVLSNKKTALRAKPGKEDGSSMDQEQALWVPHKEKLSLMTLKG
jgi:hypothetical protein